MRRTEDPLDGLSGSLEAEHEHIARRFNDAERFTQGGLGPRVRGEVRGVRAG